VTETKSDHPVKKDDDKPEHKLADIDKLQDDPRFDLANSKVRTPEDAFEAYLREDIDEAELRAVLSSLGANFYPLKGRLERPDNAYERKIPEDLFDDPALAVSMLEERKKAVKAREEKAAKASAEAEKADK
jgi:hypothetical protein